MNLTKYIFEVDNFIKRNFFSEIFIFILITFCSFKFFGYAFGFLLLIPFLLINMNNFIFYLKRTDIKEKLVFIYFLYFFTQSFIGAYKVGDIRIIIYWATFFIICSFSYFYNNYLIESKKLFNRKYIDLIFDVSTLYFLLFIFMNFVSIIFLENPWRIQNNFWVGGSLSFNISSLFLYCLFKKWSDIGFKLKTKYSIIISFYSFLVLLNDSRLGLLYLTLIIIFIILKSIAIKNIINGLLIATLCLYTYSIGSFFVSSFSLTNNPGYTSRTFLGDLQIVRKNFKKDQDISNITRLEELFIGLEKFKESNLTEKIFGTGWYSSRITIGPTRNRIINELYSEKGGITTNKINHLQGIVSLLLDTGLLGFTYTLVLFSLLLKNILTFNSFFINKLFYLSLIFTNLLCLFIGYPWINIPFILMLVPRGIFLLEEKNKFNN